MLKIGITGGIGSGKSTVARIFEQLNIPVYYADERAKALMLNDPELVRQVKGLFGEEAYTGKELNRAHISSMAFNNKQLLSQLNALVHPAVIRDFDEWSKQQKSPYVLKEAALLFESGSFRDLDYVITVNAPLKLRVERTVKRDHTDEKSVRSRIRRQWSEKARLESADFIIVNDGKKALIPQVMKLHKKFLFAAE